jgi:hypothetical protein
MELGINRRIALEVDVRCNACETLARIPRYWNIFRGLVVVSVALKTIEGTAETIRIGSIGTARLLL